MSKLTMEIVVHLSPGQFVQVSSRVLLGKEQHTNLQQTQQLSVKRSKHVMFHEVNTYSDITLVTIIIDILTCNSYTHHKVKLLLILPMLSNLART